MNAFLKKAKKTLIGNRAFYMTVLGILVPMVIQNGITNFVSLLDNLMVGALGDALTPRLCYTLCGLLSLAASFTLIWGGRRAVAPVFDPPAAPQSGE